MKTKPLSSYTRRDPEFNFVTAFDPTTGAYLRTGVLDEKGHDTGQDPFMAFFPHILDVGIMGHCQHGLSGLCAGAGTQCYQSGGVKSAPNMTFEDFRALADQSAGKVQQFALGGRGDPEMHEDFASILAYTRDRGIVPNLTTSGFGLDEHKAHLIKEHCGAAAVSWYRTPYTMRAIDLLAGLGVKTNIHFVLSKDSIGEAIDLLSRGGLPKGINRFILLLFKPIGLGRREQVLAADDGRVRELFSLLADQEVSKRAGYDSCSVPALVNHARALDPRSYDTCEGGRFSAYVTPDLVMTPCSFDQELKYGKDLRTVTMAAAWRSLEFDRFRAHLAFSCPACPDRQSCMGGCPLVPEIVLCARDIRATRATCEMPQDGSDYSEIPL